MRHFHEKLFCQTKPYLSVIFMQFGYAGMAIISMFALNQGMSPYVFVAYCHAVATLVIAPLRHRLRKILPVLLWYEVQYSNLCNCHVQYSTCSFIPHGLGLQAITLKSYPAELSLTALICLVGTMGGTVVALIMERGNPAAWSLHFDSKLLAVVYGGIICSGVSLYIEGVVMQKKGPVFVTAVSPLEMILVAIMSSFIFSEIMYLGRVIGAAVIIAGLYLVLWGKSKDQLVTNKSDVNDKIAASEQQMTAEDEMISKAQSSQEFLVLDVVKREQVDEPPQLTC